MQDGPPTKSWFSCQKQWHYTHMKRVMIKSLLLNLLRWRQWGFLEKSGWLSSTSKTGFWQQRQETCLVYLWSLGEVVRLGWGARGWFELPTGAKGVRFSYYLPRYQEKGIQKEWGLKAVSCQTLKQNGARFFIAELMRRTSASQLPTLSNWIWVLSNMCLLPSPRDAEWIKMPTTF